MSEIFEIVGYHATDTEFVSDILNNGFKFKNNPKHWLGNGIYFFTEEELAQYWTKGPTKTFGAEINKPAIIKANIECEGKHVYDLRIPSTYLKAKKAENEFKEYVDNIGVQQEYTPEQARCMFFEMLKKQVVIDGCPILAIIACFYKPHPTYLDVYYNILCHIENKDISIILPEIQICVCSNDVIIGKELV